MCSWVGTKGFVLAVGHPSTSSLHQEGFWGREAKSGGISPGRSIVVVCSGAWLLPGLSKQELEPFPGSKTPQRYPKPPKLLPRPAPEEVTAGGTMPLGGKGGEEEDGFLLLGNFLFLFGCKWG